MPTTLVPIDRRTDRLHTIGLEANGVMMDPYTFDTHDDWDPNYTYEIINGVLIVAPPPDIRERDPNEELGYLLRLYRDDPHCTMDATVSEHTVCTADDRRRADRVVWVGLGRTPDPSEDVPQIVIEFVSSGRRSTARDYVVKRQEYIGVGVLEYWVIDRFERSMTLFLPGGKSAVVGENAVYTTPLLPGFKLPLSRLFAAADRWDKPVAKSKSKGRKRKS